MPVHCTVHCKDQCAYTTIVLSYPYGAIIFIADRLIFLKTSAPQLFNAGLSNKLRTRAYYLFNVSLASSAKRLNTMLWLTFFPVFFILFHFSSVQVVFHNIQKLTLPLYMGHHSHCLPYPKRKKSRSQSPPKKLSFSVG
jgi:hypothetical protein